MKAPDKIYTPNELLSEEWQRHIEGEDTAYLRKDALLEWAREQLEVYNAHLKDHNDMALWHERYAFQQMIDKLNSL